MPAAQQASSPWRDGNKDWTEDRKGPGQNSCVFRQLEAGEVSFGRTSGDQAGVSVPLATLGRLHTCPGLAPSLDGCWLSLGSHSSPPARPLSRRPCLRPGSQVPRAAGCWLLAGEQPSPNLGSSLVSRVPLSQKDWGEEGEMTIGAGVRYSQRDSSFPQESRILGAF